MAHVNRGNWQRGEDSRRFERDDGVLSGREERVPERGSAEFEARPQEDVRREAWRDEGRSGGFDRDRGYDRGYGGGGYDRNFGGYERDSGRRLAYGGYDRDFNDRNFGDRNFGERSYSDRNFGGYERSGGSGNDRNFGASSSYDRGTWNNDRSPGGYERNAGGQSSYDRGTWNNERGGNFPGTMGGSGGTSGTNSRGYGAYGGGEERGFDRYSAGRGSGDSWVSGYGPGAGYATGGGGTMYEGQRWTGGERYDTRGDYDRGGHRSLGDRMREGMRKLTGKGPKGYQRSDERIREDVCEAIARSNCDADNVEVNVKDGEVTLSGYVTDRRDKRYLEDLVEDLFGVKDVHNHVRVDRGGLQAAQTTGTLGNQRTTTGTSTTATPNTDKGNLNRS